MGMLRAGFWMVELRFEGAWIQKRYTQIWRDPPVGAMRAVAPSKSNIRESS